MSIKDTYYTISEAAKELNVSRQTIYRWIADNKIPTEKVGGIILVEKQPIQKYAVKRGLEFFREMLDGLAIDYLRRELSYTNEYKIKRVANRGDDLVFLVTRQNGTSEKVLVGGAEVAIAMNKGQKTPVITGMKLTDITRRHYKGSKHNKEGRQSK